MPGRRIKHQFVRTCLRFFSYLNHRCSRGRLLVVCGESVTRLGIALARLQKRRGNVQKNQECRLWTRRATILTKPARSVLMWYHLTFRKSNVSHLHINTMFFSLIIPRVLRLLSYTPCRLPREASASEVGFRVRVASLSININLRKNLLGYIYTYIYI